MLKQRITYTNGNGEKEAKDYYFNLTWLDYARLESRYVESENETLTEYIKRITESHQVKKTLELLEDIILSSYGEKSADGERFVKSKEIRENFSYSWAYAKLFEDLMEDPRKFESFTSKILSKPMAEKKAHENELANSNTGNV